MSGHDHDHEGEPVPGLPERLPEGEHILWQGAPRWTSLAVRAFHVRKLAIYFGLLMLLRALESVRAGSTTIEAAADATGLLPLALLALGLVLLLARLSAGSTLYTLTNRRLVMRFGIALPMSVNVPYRMVDSASIRLFGNGCGDLPLQLADGQRLGYVVTWPHVRLGKGGKAGPMLRSVPGAEQVGTLLVQALERENGQSRRSEALAVNGSAAVA